MGNRAETRSQNQGASTPRAVIHKRILDEAKDHPNVSMEELASKVNAATLSLVERVLDEYGDPGGLHDGHDEEETGKERADDSPEQIMHDTLPEDETPTSDDESPSQTEEGSPGGEIVDSADLTNKQKRTLAAIYEHPTETQAELAERFGVTPATINTRLNSIDDFEWKDRHKFARQIAKRENEIESEKYNIENIDSIQELNHRVRKLSEKIEILEENIEKKSVDPDSAIDDPELVSVVVRACVKSEIVTEDEETEIITELFEAGRTKNA